MMRVSYSSIGADCHCSRPLPCGMPSAMSTRPTTFARSFSAIRCAVVAPTLPAPTTVIVLTMDARDVMGGLRQRAEVIGGVVAESICRPARESGVGNRVTHETRMGVGRDRPTPIPIPLDSRALPSHLAQRPRSTDAHL